MDTVECGWIYLNPTDNFIIVIPMPVDAFVPPIVVVLSIWFAATDCEKIQRIWKVII